MNRVVRFELCFSLHGTLVKMDAQDVLQDWLSVLYVPTVILTCDDMYLQSATKLLTH